jgi:hypothetical protein
MNRHRLIILGFLASSALLLIGWTLYPCASDQLHCVEFQRPNGEFFRTEAPEFLSTVEAWRASIEGPSLRQRVLRSRGAWIENGLRQADYQVTLVYKNGCREEMSVWVYAEDYVPVHCQGYSCLARTDPFTAFVECLQDGGH